MKFIIWIAWNLSCWKTTIANYISSRLKIDIFENSDVLKKIANERKIEINRENLISISKELDEIYWRKAIAEILIKEINSKWIISWIRIFEQASFLKSNSNFILIYVEADKEKSVDRLIKRNKQWDPKNLKEYESFLKKERTEDLEKIKSFSDYKIINDKSLEDLYLQLDNIINKIKNEILIK